MHKPVNPTSISRAAAMQTDGFSYDPGGERSHDLRIKRTLPRSDNSPTQGIASPGAVAKQTRNAPEEKHPPVRSASPAQASHKAVVGPTGRTRKAEAFGVNQ